MDIKIVCGANYGDEGKGLVTNCLTDESKRTLNVLSCNSSQRGHTVVHNNIRHVFRHFGSGTLKGAHTLFTGNFIINPIMFREEYEKLQSVGITPIVFYDPYCCVVTPYDMLANQIIETSRGKNRHGSCGCGVYESIVRRDSQFSAGGYEGVFFAKRIDDILADIEGYYKKKLVFPDYKLGEKQFDSFCTDTTRHKFYDDVIFFMTHATPLTFSEIQKLFGEYDLIIFENSQGLMLSSGYGGDNEHTTPVDVGSLTPMSDISLYADFDEINSIEFIYVTRTYFTRHGAGPIGVLGGSECTKAAIHPWMEDKTNGTNEWQGEFRYGIMSDKDIKCLVNRITADKRHSENYIKGNSNIDNIEINKTVVITHENEYHNQALIDALTAAGFTVRLSYDERSIDSVGTTSGIWNYAIRW